MEASRPYSIAERTSVSSGIFNSIALPSHIPDQETGPLPLYARSMCRCTVTTRRFRSPSLCGRVRE